MRTVEYLLSAGWSLLNEARENAEKLLDVLYDVAGGKELRSYRKRACKNYLKYTRSRKHTTQKTGAEIRKQLGYLKRDLDAIDAKLSMGKALSERQSERPETLCIINEQQKYMYDNNVHSAPEPYCQREPAVYSPNFSGHKACKPVEFGAKLDISVVNGWTRLDFFSIDAYNEAGNLQEIAERFYRQESHYPKRILADKTYHNRDNLAYCKEHHILPSDPALGRPKKDTVPNKKQAHIEECECVEVERCFSRAKRKCGMGLVTAKLQETAAHMMAMPILILNLRRDSACAFVALVSFAL